VVWQVVDSAEAVYNVDDYESFVHIQSESALRAMATSYPYDQHDDGTIALRSHAAEIAKHLTEELQERLALAGVNVMEARISHLAYAPEIAQAMLQRQQAGAIIAARTRIVEGAVSMVEMALSELSKRNVVDLDPSAARRWSATCWSCSAASAARSRSSTPARSTEAPTWRRRRPIRYACRPRCWTPSSAGPMTTCAR
jgi:hypothetical protein